MEIIRIFQREFGIRLEQSSFTKLLHNRKLSIIITFPQLIMSGLLVGMLFSNSA